VVQHSFQIGESTFAIRTTSHEFGAWLERSLAEYRVEEEADPLFSVVVSGGEENGDSRGKKFHILYWGSSQLARSLDLSRVGRALVSEVGRMQVPERDDALYLDAVPVAVDGATALVTSDYVARLGSLGRRLVRSGIRLPAARTAVVDGGAGTVSLLPQPADIPEGAVEELAAHPGSREEPGIPEQPVGVDFVCFGGEYDQEETLRASRAQAVYELGARVLNLRKLRRAALDELSRLVQAPDLYSLAPAVDAKAVAKALTQIAGR
jgi:hypothetical protein